ncbi:hypothetical protein TNCV_3874651 [Trichonephila clavipes]|nr:hypothetical protein TNCV_3874651 [Trichonephila clavipes]
MVEERDVRGHSMSQSLFMRALHVLFQSPLQGWRPTMRQGTGSSRCISQSSNNINNFTYTSATRGAVCQIQTIRIRSWRLIRLPNSVRMRTTHLKESQLDPFIPGQIQMTRKHNDHFPNDRGMCTPKLGSNRMV